MEISLSSATLTRKKPHGVIRHKTNFNASIPRFTDAISSVKSDPQREKPYRDAHGRARAAELTVCLAELLCKELDRENEKETHIFAVSHSELP